MTKTIGFETPALYGDHHVIEIRRILLGLAGVEDVYASSAFRAVEVTFDPDKVHGEDIKKKLDELGYLEELISPVEASASTYLDSDRTSSFFRHTATYEASRNDVSFAQTVVNTGRPLWHCPGFGVIKNEMEE